ncbi:MAG: regulatory protein RecX [Flavobacterium sp.]
MNTLNYKEVIRKLEYYCSYQERCHQEVQQKLKSFFLSAEEREHIIVHLIEQNYLNEERFAEVYTLSKFHQKKWGKKRIESELKIRNISPYLITKSLQLIEKEHYQQVFEQLAEKTWEQLTTSNLNQKEKKWFDSLFRKGYETAMIQSYFNNFLKNERK